MSGVEETGAGGTRVAAVIADLVGSRGLEDRAGAQEQVLAAWSRAHGQVLGAERTAAGGDSQAAAGGGVPPWATVGDEFQAVYPDLATALRALVRLMLDLEEPVRLRFGVGLGAVTTLDEGPDGPIQDGDAWWAARAAIDAGRERDRRGAVIELGWAEAVAGTSGNAPEQMDTEETAESGRPAGGGTPGIEAAAARLLEHVVGQMKPRERRIVRATLDGVYQKDIAEAEGVSQSAVSQSLSRSGGRTLLDVDRLLAETTASPAEHGAAGRPAAGEEPS